MEGPKKIYINPQYLSMNDMLLIRSLEHRKDDNDTKYTRSDLVTAVATHSNRILDELRKRTLTIAEAEAVIDLIAALAAVGEV